MPLEKTLERIERDIAAGDYGKARDRLHGLIATYPDDFSLRRTLGDVYWQLQYPAMAGRYWYLEEKKSPDMVTACVVFERSCGNNPFHILLALKYRGDIQTSRDTFAGRTLLALQKQVKDQYGYCIDFKKRGAERYQWTPVSRGVWQERLVLAGCIVTGFAILGLIGIGLDTVWKWIF
jgi:hypothetical protein